MGWGAGRGGAGRICRGGVEPHCRVCRAFCSMMISHFAFRETGHFAFRILRNRTLCDTLPSHVILYAYRITCEGRVSQSVRFRKMRNAKCPVSRNAKCEIIIEQNALQTLQCGSTPPRQIRPAPPLPAPHPTHAYSGHRAFVGRPLPRAACPAPSSTSIATTAAAAPSAIVR